MKYLLVRKGDVFEVVESEPDEVWQVIMDLKYPNGFISLTAMEDAGGPY
jgi:hypothetical protein